MQAISSNPPILGQSSTLQTERFEPIVAKPTNDVKAVDTLQTPGSGLGGGNISLAAETVGNDEIAEKTDEGTVRGKDVTKESSATKRVSFEDFLDLNEILFEWADSYDNKDWPRLAKILAPLMIVDYSIVGHQLIEDMPAAEFVGMMSSPAFLGDPLVRTQHLMGARKYERISDTEIIGHHQIRAAHQRYFPDGVTVENRGHGHSYIKHWYIKIDGVWKLRGLCPKVYWNEHRFDKIFLQLDAER